MMYSLPYVSVVTGVMTRKRADGLPLTRQEEIWERQVAQHSRVTLANWGDPVRTDVLKPLYWHMKQVLLKESLICADKTVMQVLKKGETAAPESWMWLYTSEKMIRKAVRLFEYWPDRSAKRPASVFSGFSTYLVTDCYAG